MHNEGVIRVVVNEGVSKIDAYCTPYRKGQSILVCGIANRIFLKVVGQPTFIAIENVTLPPKDEVNSVSHALYDRIKAAQEVGAYVPPKAKPANGRRFAY